MISISINLDSHKVHLASPTILAFSINEILGTLFLRQYMLATAVMGAKSCKSIPCTYKNYHLHL